MNANNDTRQFLARVVAWPQEGDTPAFVNIHNTFIPPNLKKDAKGNPIYIWTGRAVKSVDAAISYIQWQSKESTCRDLYFCTSTQAMAEERTDKRGQPYYVAKRAQENAVKLKSLFIDIDLKDGDNGYASENELFAALAGFLEFTGLPKPSIVVHSGGGVHVYWLLQDALFVPEWMELSFALVEAIKRYGLKCDSQCTIDAARVLRIPGTMNLKYDPPREVKLLGMADFDYLNKRITDSLEPFKVKVPHTMQSVSMTLFPPRGPITTPSDLSAGVEVHKANPADLDQLSMECGFVADALATGGADYTNPLWNLTTLMATFTKGGRVDAHRMANGHPEYSVEETDALYDRKQQERATKNLGWPTCSVIKSSGCNACGTCPHLVENKSPFNFEPLPKAPDNSVKLKPSITTAGNTALPPAQQTYTPATKDPDLPDMYMRQPAGTICVGKDVGDGTIHYSPVSPYPMTDPWLQREPWVLYFNTVTSYGKTAQISVPMAVIGSSEMRSTLQSQGLMLRGGAKGFSDMSEFLMAWITKLQSERDKVVTSSSFGWHSDNGSAVGFVYSGTMYTPKGEEPALNTDPELNRQFTPTGNINEWYACAKMITDQKRPELDAILAASFGGPLVRFTGHSGLLLSAYSVESGIGKSTALKVAQAVWGDPVKAVQSLSDTQNSVLNKMGELRSLPLFWDELQSEDDNKRFVDTVFRLTLGKEKSRMTSKITQRAPGTWQTIMVAAANDSLMDAVGSRSRATMAGVYRVFEYRVRPPVPGSPGQIDPTVAQRQLSKLNDNFGNVGLEYAKFLGANIGLIEKNVAETSSKIGKAVNMQQDERFWVGMIACLMVGAAYANTLKFTEIDLDGLRVFLIDCFKNMRRTRRTSMVDIQNPDNVVSILSRFLNEKRARNTLITNIVHRQSGRPPVGTISIVNDASRLETIMVHIGDQDKVIRIGKDFLFEWLTQNNHPRKVFVDALEATLQAKHISGRLGTGTMYASGQSHLLEIDLAALPHINML